MRAFVLHCGAGALDRPGVEAAARECRALSAAGELFPRARKRLLTLTHDRLPAGLPAGTELQTACDWFLENAR